MIKYGSRKFLLALATLLIASVLVVTGDITALIWRDVVIAICGAYMAANVTQKALVKPETPLAKQET